MKQLLNTLYVQTDRAWLRLDHDTVRVDVEGETRLRVPLLQLSAIVCFGDVGLSTPLLRRCAEDGRSVAFMTRTGRFSLRLEGPVTGNVLLRRAQHLALSDPDRRVRLARNMLAGKLRNSRQVLLRAGREAARPEDRLIFAEAAAEIAAIVGRLPTRGPAEIESLRGDEGDAAAIYFSVFGGLVRREPEAFGFRSRTRRPPLDRMNALLSFLYTLLRSDCVGALEGVGLDAQVGFLHALRPGRPALALDLMEELRPVVADRLALALVNRGQLSAGHFDVQESGATLLNDAGRRIVLTAYQERKAETVQHRIARQPVPWGLVPHLQARLLARHLREDLAHYPPFLTR